MIYLQNVITENKNWIIEFQKLVEALPKAKEKSEEFSEEGVEVDTSIDKVSNITFRQLNYSLLSGEYWRDSSFQAHFDSFDQIFESHQNIALDLPEIIKSHYQEFINEFRLAIKHYKEFHLSVTASEAILYIARPMEGISTWFIEEMGHSSRGYQRFKRNLLVSKADHNLSTDNRLIGELMQIRSEIKEQDHVDEWILGKCDFLIRKIKIRLMDTEVPVKVIQGGKVVDLDKDFDENSPFQPFLQHIETYYEYPKRRNRNDLRDIGMETRHELRKVIKDEGTLENVPFRGLQVAFKYYKDDESNSMVINELSDSLNKIIDKTDVFDSKYSDTYKLNICYFSNYWLSTQVKLNSDQAEVSTRIQETIKLHDEYGVDNFFPYKKGSQYYIGVLNKLFRRFEGDSELFERNKDKSIGYLKELDILLKGFKKKLIRCDELNFLQFRMPFDQSVIKIEVESTPLKEIFVHSGTTVPLNFKREWEIYNECLAEKLKLNGMFELLSHIQSSKNEVDEVKTQIEKSERNSIEILGIFSAVVVFGFGSINIYGHLNNTQDAILFSAFFALSLVTFVIALWFVSRGSIHKTINEHGPHAKYAWAIFFIWLLLIIVLLISPETPIDWTNS